MFWVFFSLSIIFVEAITELICKSLFFNSSRNYIMDKSEWLRKLLSCGYCTSVWVSLLPAAFLTFWYVGFTYNFIFVFILFTIVLHRLSNKFHDFGDKVLDKYYDPRFKK